MKRLVRCIAPKWLQGAPIEGEFSESDIQNINLRGYNIFYWPNTVERDVYGTPINGTNVVKFDYLFVDYDSKSNNYASKDAFIEKLADIMPSQIVDSGNGIHAYWKVVDLDAMGYLRLQRRLIRYFNTDEATSSLAQLMRLPGTLNTKVKDNFIPCDKLLETDSVYSAEELDSILPPITTEDEQFCQNHYNKTYNVDRENISIDETLPPKFGKLLLENHEVKDLWSQVSDDRSKTDFRLGHIMFASGFTKEEAASVLVNSAKAMSRAPVHRQSYAINIIDKIWTFELEPEKVEKLSLSVEELLKRPNTSKNGEPLRCHKLIDNTDYGFRLGQVIGLVAGSGVGKTSFSMNMFKWFIEQNPNYHHFFIPLEQPAHEIADRWSTMTRGDTTLNSKVHVISNYDEQGNFRHLSFDEIQDYLEVWQKDTGHKIGCVVIDHIGALKKKGAKDENQDLMTICHKMKAFAIQTNTLLIMQSQTNREKAGIGDLELNKDAAYGTATFEWYCDYLITMWQPLKRCHMEQSCPTVTAFKYCKIRHKKPRKDVIQEDVCYFLYFDSETETMRQLTQDEQTSFNFFLPKATNKRKADRKSELVAYQSVPEERIPSIEATIDSDRSVTRH